MKRPLGLAVCAAASAVLCWAYSGSLVDDAYIVFRYADHLLAGMGPVFNPGERVEGFTSPLWLLLLAGSRAAGAGYEASVAFVGAAFAIATVLLTGRLATRVAGYSIAALVAPAYLALHPGHAMWAVHGLETALFACLVAAVFLAWTSDAPGAARRAGLLLGVAFWTRPEAGLVALVLAASALARGEKRRAVALIGWCAVPAIPLVAARLAYFGALTPNTFQAKSGGGWGRVMFGLGYARLFVQTHIAIVVLAGVAAWKAFRGTEAPRVVTDAVAVGAAWSVYVVAVGGDAFPGFRFWLPILPPAAVVASWGLGAIRSERTRAVAAAGVILTVLFPVADVHREWSTGRAFTEKMTTAGTWLGTHAPRGTWIAVNYVGALPYFAGLPTIDMLGLTDPVIAGTPIAGRFRFPGHAKGNGASVLDRRPGIILMNGVHLEKEPMTELRPELDSEEQIAADPRFAAEYEPVNVPIDGRTGRLWLGFHKRKDLAWNPLP